MNIMTHLTQQPFIDFSPVFSAEDVEEMKKLHLSIFENGHVDQFIENRKKLKAYIESLDKSLPTEKIAELARAFSVSNFRKSNACGFSFDHLTSAIDAEVSAQHSFVQLFQSPYLDSISPRISEILAKFRETIVAHAAPGQEDKVRHGGTISISFISGNTNVAAHIDPIPGFRVICPITPVEDVTTFFYKTQITTVLSEEYKSFDSSQAEVISTANFETMRSVLFNQSIMHSCDIKQKEPLILLKYSFNNMFDLRVFKGF